MYRIRAENVPPRVRARINARFRASHRRLWQGAPTQAYRWIRRGGATQPQATRAGRNWVVILARALTLLMVSSAPALAQNPSCIFTMPQPFTFTASCVGQPDINHNVVVGEVVRGVIDVDMGEWQCLQMDVDVKKAQGWVLNFGNSPTNDGFAGDGGDFTHDSEFEIFVPGPTPGPPGGPLPLPGSQTPGALNVYTNDLAAPPSNRILSIPNFYPGGAKTSKLRFEVGRRSVSGNTDRFTMLFRKP